MDWLSGEITCNIFGKEWVSLIHKEILQINKRR